jgi:hypothetical protein
VLRCGSRLVKLLDAFATSGWRIRWRTYRVHFKIPWLARLVKVDDDLLILKAKLLDHNVCAVRPRAAVVRVESDGVGGATHDV